MQKSKIILWGISIASTHLKCCTADLALMAELITHFANALDVHSSTNCDELCPTEVQQYSTSNAVMQSKYAME